jgi:hypothetical protein
MFDVALTALVGAVAAAVAGAAAVFVWVVVRPQLAAYLYVFLSPLIVGFARGDLIPVLRPNEALLLFIFGALCARTLLTMLARRYSGPLFGPLDAAIALLVLTGSVGPLLLRYARGLSISTDDLLYSIVLWKYLLLYRVFRASIVTEAQVARCLSLSMISAATVALIGIFQVEDLFGIPEFLHAYYDQPFEGHTGVMTDRGTSTVGSAFGVADLMVMNLIVAIALLHGRQGGRWRLVVASGIFLSGCIIAGEFSGFIGLGVAVLAFGFISRRALRVLAAGAAAAAIASVVFWQVIATRLDPIVGSSSLPNSWQGRWENLQHFFLPQLFSELNWLWGVRPAPRIPAPETWRQWVYLESGYVWLLWVGGIPLVIAFVFFVWVSAQCLWRVTREQNDAIWAAAAAGLAYLAVLVVLTLFDPHLTLRGSADLFFPLLALSSVRGRYAYSASGFTVQTAQAETVPVIAIRVHARNGRIVVGRLLSGPHR